MRHSYGIALCRLRKNGIPEILLVKKRFSYEFHEFVLGKYKKNDQRGLINLFNGMTIQEKLDITGLDFSAIWYRLWAEIPSNNNLESRRSPDKPDEMYIRRQKYCKAHKQSAPMQSRIISSYIKNRARFESLIENGSKFIVHLINNSVNAGAIWEIPKGRCENNETPLDAAMREFIEETNVQSYQYEILWDIDPINITYTDQQITYHTQYFLAKTLPVDSNQKRCDFWSPRIPFNINSQKQEIEYAKWVTLTEIQYLQISPASQRRLVTLVRRVFRQFRKMV